MNRRDFLYGMGGLIMAPTISFSAEKNDKSVIFIWLGGGASSVEITNPLPDGLDKYRSCRGHIQTNTPGLYLSADMVEMSKITHLYSTIRGLKSRDSNHETSTMEYLTSQPHIPNQSQNFPSAGSVLCSTLGAYNKSMPRYIKVNKIGGDDAAFLGSGNAGFDLDREGIDNLKPRVAQSQFDRRIKLMNQIDEFHGRKDLINKEWIGIKGAAVDIVKGDVSKALDLKNVDDLTQKCYGVGKSNFGRDLLIARRLVESGASYVNVSMGGFDLHSGIYCGMGRLVPELDLYLSILINDLNKTGKLKDTLIIVTSEFSRTAINATAGDYNCVSNGVSPISTGRDHNANANTLILAGGNYNHGLRGATDKTGIVAESNVVGPKDLYKTILGHFGINDLTVTDTRGRPRFIIEKEAKNILI